MTFLDANHCPGSALLHFRHRSTNRVVLHTGDFRASRAVRDDPLLAALLRAHGRVDELMLDTKETATPGGRSRTATWRARRWRRSSAAS